MTQILMLLSSESMSIQLSELDNNNSVTIYCSKSDMCSKHSLILRERELRELRKFITIQIRKIKNSKTIK